MAEFTLRREGLLANMDEDWLAQLSEYGQLQPVQLREVIIQQGDTNNRLFVVVEGAMEVLCTTEGCEFKLADILRGECFGEVSIFEPAPASATVRATAAGFVWSLDVDNLQNYMDHHPYEGCTLLLGINQQLSRRLRVANATIRSHNFSTDFLSIRNRIKGAVGSARK